MENLPVLIVLLPLCAALLSLLLSKLNLLLSKVVVISSIGVSLVMSCMLLDEVITEGNVHYSFGNYKMPFGIEFSIDTINALIVVLIFIIGFITALFCTSFEKGQSVLKISGANSLIALLIVGMAGMTLTGDVFNLYVFLEITSLSAYCLIALGGSKGIISAFRYLLIGTVAASFYLLGVGILYSTTGTLNMADMARILDEPGHEQPMLIAMVLLIVAFSIKMAQFPFHGWQPSAYTHAQVSARPLIAGVMGKIPAYAMFRYIFCIYGVDYKYTKYFLSMIGIFAVCGMIYGSLRAMAQTDIRKMLAYSSVAQISYIVLGFAIGNPFALVGAFLHMLGHAFMKSGLFFCTGAISYKFNTVKMDDFGYIYKKMPITMTLLVVAALSMVGIPPTVGFFSKWYLASGAASAGQYVYIIVLVISSLLNAVYFFRLIEKVFMGKEKKTLPPSEVNEREIPISMMIAIIVPLAAILLLGIFNVKIVNILLMSIKGVAL